jgi:hypothetical protein
MFPGKGIHLVLNEEVLHFVQKALGDVNVCFMDEANDESPGIVIDALTGDGDEQGEMEFEWTEENDSFGHKAITKMAYKEGELRVTVVLTKRGMLALDIREWYEPVGNPASRS